MPVSVSGPAPGGSRGPRGSLVHDHVALAEIELCGELMIAASAAAEAGEERLSPARIDEVLRVMEPEREAEAESAPPSPRHRYDPARGRC
ncbi:hypothetical protein [Streptomyces sp. JJ36]|uniref:hypothetical protein n=1 Tax=Streptomyces sp. JJ36 TaxID=2736645 RepID=UPI001F2DFD7E|nr:hypothetical protein [Streptomyces sp. JJ36]MCF6524201.1 hypothetical protein [Streptomyces sp. JJ36]